MYQAARAGGDPGREFKLKTPTPEEYLIRNLLPRFLGDHYGGKPSEKNQRRAFEIHVIPVWGDRDVRTIDLPEIREFLRGFGSRPLGNSMDARLKQFFKWLRLERLIAVNPMTDLAGIKPAKERPRDRCLSARELGILWHVSSVLEWPWSGLLVALIVTWQRRTQVATMEWGHLLHLDDSALARWEVPKEKMMKADRAHIIPIPDPLRTMLLARQEEHGSEQYVFSTRGGWAPISGLSYFKKLVDDAALAEGWWLEAWDLHDLRRTGTSLSGEHVRYADGRPVEPFYRDRILNHGMGRLRGTYDKNHYFTEKKFILDGYAEFVLRCAQSVPNTQEARKERLREMSHSLKRKKVTHSPDSSR